jgi:hypothetical protein
VASIQRCALIYTGTSADPSATEAVAEMKTATTTVYLGQPLDEPSEQSFLERLRADLRSRCTPALILANFITGHHFRQVDFLIVTAVRAVHCELKAYAFPVVGTVTLAGVRGGE